MSGAETGLCSANALTADIHNTGNHPQRMPAILRAKDRDIWLRGTPEEARVALAQYPADLMVAYQVSTRVNNVKNNSPDLMEPIDKMGPEMAIA